MPSYRLEYKSVSKSEHAMLNDLDDIILANKIPEKTADRLRLMISEAFTNALTHGNKYDPSKMITITITIKDSEIIADIKDEGSGGIKRISKRKPPKLLSEGGRGIDLIKHYSDSMDYHENEEGHLILSITLTLPENKNINVKI